MRVYLILILLLASCTERVGNMSGNQAVQDSCTVTSTASPQVDEIQEVDSNTLEPNFNDDTIGQAEYLKRYGK